MTSAQSRLDKAIIAHEHAEAEVERLCNIVERAADALNQARQAKRAAQKELDAAAKAANKGNTAASQIIVNTRHAKGRQQAAAAGNGARVTFAANGHRREETEQDEESDDEESEYTSEEYEEEDDEEEEGGFDMGNEALEQIRYRLETAKIDPNSPVGTKLLDELLVRLQTEEADVIDAELVNEFIDELLSETEENTTNGAAGNQKRPPPPQSQYPQIMIHRGGKLLGLYQGQVDERGYAREGYGSMYYDAGHECHGTWQNDEMVGRGIYKWSDGHIYDGEWVNGKRHGLGRFIRPDNVVLFGWYEKGHHKGEGVRWSADRKEAQMVVDGVPKKSVSLVEARKIGINLGFEDVPPGDGDAAGESRVAHA